MIEKSTQTERLLTLTCVLLASERGLTKAEIYEVVRGYKQKLEGSSAANLSKLFERDKEILRDLGVAIEVITPDHNPEDNTDARYRISQQDFTWPADLKLSSRQMALLELAARAWSRSSLSEPAQRGLTKLKALGIAAFDDLIGYAPMLRSTDRNFEAISTAIANQQNLRLNYRKLDSEQVSAREIQPWRLRQLEGEWVLLGLDTEIFETRNFLLRRILGAVEVQPTTFDIDEQQILEAEIELDRYIESNRALLEIASGTEAEFSFGASGQLEISYMDEELLAEDLLELGSAVRVLAPESLRNRIRDSYLKVVSLHA